jgi:hypothetical protein
MTQSIPWSMDEAEWDDFMVETDVGEDLHIVPVDDLIEHEVAPNCVCGPHVEFLGSTSDRLVAHWPLDRRE